jgi:hypothetical protein
MEDHLPPAPFDGRHSTLAGQAPSLNRPERLHSFVLAEVQREYSRVDKQFHPPSEVVDVLYHSLPRLASRRVMLGTWRLELLTCTVSIG